MRIATVQVMRVFALFRQWLNPAPKHEPYEQLYVVRMPNGYDHMVLARDSAEYVTQGHALVPVQQTEYFSDYTYRRLRTNEWPTSVNWNHAGGLVK